MSLYNQLFGYNPFAAVLLSGLGVDAINIPRFRDCFVNAEGLVVIFTRTGGGNRDEYENREQRRAAYPEASLEGPYNDDLRKLKGFVEDHDDEMDPTYAHFTYKPEPGTMLAVIADGIVKANKTHDPKKAWEEMFKALDSAEDSFMKQRALEVGKRIFDEMEKKPSGGIVEV